MGDRPQKGIIAGGLRVLTQNTVLTKDSSTDTYGSLASDSYA